LRELEVVGESCRLEIQLREMDGGWIWVVLLAVLEREAGAV